MSNEVDVVELIAQATMNRIIFLPENYYRRLIEQMKERNEVYSSNNPLGYQGIMCLGHHVCLIRDLEKWANEQR